MEVKEEKLLEEQLVREMTIPVFTVLKNGAILKNIFVVNSRDFSSPERNGATVCDDDEVEEVLVVGRHPDCDILLTHPSISRFHLEIRSIPSRQKLFVTDLSSVHGTWVADQKIEPDACVEVKEGDVIRIGGSTRTYRLHWIPLSRAYDIESPFVSPVDAATVMDQEEENRMLDVENLEVSYQSLVKTASGDDGDLHLDVTSEGSGSSVPSEDADTYLTTRVISLSLVSPSVLSLASDSELKFNEDLHTSEELDLDVVEAASKNPSSTCSPRKQQQSGGYPESSCCSELEFDAEAYELDVKGDGGLHVNVMSERMESSVPYEDEDSFLNAKETSSLPLPTDSIKTKTLHFPQDVHVSTELAINILEANADYRSSDCSPSKGQITGSFEASGCSAFELAAEIGNLSLNREVAGETEIFTMQVMEVSAEPLTKAEIQSHEDNGETKVLRNVIAVFPSSFSQAERNEETQDVIISEFQSEMAIGTESENLHQKSNGETMVGSRQASAVSDCLFTGNKHLSRIKAEDTQSLCSSSRRPPESEVRDPSEIWSEVKPAEDKNQKSRMTRETKKICDERSRSCLSEDLKESGTQRLSLTPIQKPVMELSIDSWISEESYSLSERDGKTSTCKGSQFPSTLAAETHEVTKLAEELPSDSTGSQESKTPQTHTVRDAVLSEMDSSRSSLTRLSTCNIWSRRGKSASILQLRTNKTTGKQKQSGNKPKSQVRREQALSDKSASLAVHHVAEKLEPEIFTPDKENLTPSSHMLKRLQDIGDLKDSKSSSKLSGKSKIPSSIDTVASVALTEPEIFTPHKENLSPNSHMLKRLREVKGSSSKATRKTLFEAHLEENVIAETKSDLHSIVNKPKVKHEPLEPKMKTERAPFRPLLEKSSSQSQSYTEASFKAPASNNISRGIRSSSILSDTKSKMKWTIVLDTSSLLEKESRKPLQLLQGLKGTHLVVPQTVLRELNEIKHSRGLLFRRRREIACSALDWMEECKVNTKWWVHVQSSSEETKATAPTPPVTPQSTFPFSLHWNNNVAEIDSPTSEDQVLECALVYRNHNSDEKLVLLSNDVNLKIKAMAEGMICETAHEFYESLVNPLSERFMWRESSARGRTWRHVDDIVLRERYNGTAKGLKLILLHNSHYGHNQ